MKKKIKEDKYRIISPFSYEKDGKQITVSPGEPLPKLPAEKIKILLHEGCITGKNKDGSNVAPKIDDKKVIGGFELVAKRQNGDLSELIYYAGGNKLYVRYFYRDKFILHKLLKNEVLPPRFTAGV
jgi:hypothetical protein